LFLTAVLCWRAWHGDVDPSDFWIWLVILSGSEILTLASYFILRRRIRRLPAGSIANTNAVLRKLTRWPDARNFFLLKHRDGRYLLSVNVHSSSTVHVLDSEVLCTDEQADALRKLVAQWIAYASRQASVPFIKIRS
jgi:hypothetical protein